MLTPHQIAAIHDTLVEEVDYATATQLQYRIIEIIEEEE